MRALREAVAGFGRAPLLGGLSVTSIGLSLFILGLFALTAHNIDRALARAEEQVEIVAYLAEGTGSTRAQVARDEISSYPEVTEVRYVTKVEALRNATRELPEFSDVFSELEVNPLPASLEISLAPEHRDESTVREMVERVDNYEFVEEVRYGQEWVSRIFSLRRVAAVVAGVLGAAFAVIAAMLIGTAVRMSVLARSEDIAIMQTIGAPESYIRRPFVLEGLLTGAVGGVVALGLTWGVHRLVNDTLLAVSWIPDLWVVAGVAGGGLLGMAAAWRAVHNELEGLYEL
jgi:cell division transport system permease protein